MASSWSLILLVFSVVFTSRFNLNYCHEDDKTLELAIALFRHGDRTNDLSTTYPKDPYINETYYPYDYGELTNKGKNRAYSLGLGLRELYGSFLGPVYAPGLIQSVSTDYSRTKCTLQLVLAGLFPPFSTSLEWNRGLNWNPIPFDSVDLSEDRAISIPLHFCPKYKILFDAYQETPEMKEIEEHYKPYYSYTANNTGLTINSVFDLSGLYYAITTEVEWGYDIPKWSKPVYPDFLKNASLEMYKMLVGTAQMNQLFGGFLVKKILNDMNRRIKGNTEPKMYIYSAHDMTVVGLLAALNLYDPHIPNYNACVLLELHKIDGKPHVQVRYNKDVTDKFVPMRVPGCKEMCPLEDFIKSVQKNLPEDGDPCVIKENAKRFAW